MRSIFCFLVLVLITGCAWVPRPQKGGASRTTLGGTSAPTVQVTDAPENPQTPTTTTVRKKTVREYLPGPVEPFDSRAVVHGVSYGPGEGAQGSSALRPSPVLPLRETTEEEATSSTGAAQKDTVRDLGARMANMRGVQWVGVLLFIAGPVVGYKLGWLTNGLIAGAVGLLLIIISQVLPGNEAWLGLCGLLLIPLVAFVYYKSQHDAQATAKPSP
jgi:hypothetical protein